MDMCMYCKNSTMHVVNYNNYIIVKNVLWFEYEQCREKYYTDEVMEQFEVIINMEKKLMLEIAATDYKQAS